MESGAPDSPPGLPVGRGRPLAVWAPQMCAAKSATTGSCNNNSNEGTLFGSQNQMNGQGDQGTLKMNAVHMYCAAAKKILRAARARLQNLGSNLGYPGKSKLHIPSNIQSKHSKVLVPKLHINMQ